MTPSMIISILYNEKTTKYHPIMFGFYALPGERNETPRYKSWGHHTGGFVFREEAIADCMESERKLKELGYTTGMSLEKDFLWDGEETPASVMLFVEKDGKYLPV